MPHDVALQTDLSIRLVVAAMLGAVIGLEREIHGHEAGMRTHLLVALGSAIFTVLSIYGFPRVDGTAATDPSRLAAQIVSGIGFLGAGAILKFGATIRGLTTAASLWVVAAVGLAAGTADYVLAGTGTVLAIVSLWPLHMLVRRLERSRPRQLRLRLMLARLDAFGRVSQVLVDRGIEILSIQTEPAGDGQQMDLELQLKHAMPMQRLIADLARLPDVEVRTLLRSEEA